MKKVCLWQMKTKYKQKQGRPHKAWQATFKEDLQAMERSKESCQLPQPVEETHHPARMGGNTISPMAASGVSLNLKKCITHHHILLT